MSNNSITLTNSLSTDNKLVEQLILNFNDKTIIYDWSILQNYINLTSLTLNFNYIPLENDLNSIANSVPYITNFWQFQQLASKLLIRFWHFAIFGNFIFSPSIYPLL